MTAPSQPTANKQENLNVTSAAKPSTSKTLGDSISTQQVTETKPVAYQTTTQDDASLPKGQTKVIQAGQNGVETLVYNVTTTNGQQTSKTLASDTITTKPTDEIIANGTYVAPAPTPAPTPQTTPPPPVIPTPTPPAPTQSCYPLTNGGNCYEPGEYCRKSDHYATGIAGDGENITCEYNNGWRWEPTN